MSGIIRRRHDLGNYDPRFSGLSFRDQRRSHELDDFGPHTPRRFHQRNSLEDLTFGGASSLGGQHRDATLSTLQRHLADLKKDNRQMSVRLSRAEDCLQTLENDEEIFPHNPEGFEDFDAVTPGNWTEEDDKRRRLRRDLREIRSDLDAMRNSLRREEDPYYDGRASPHSPRRQRRSHWDQRHHGGEENGLTEWGAHQLNGVWTSSPSRQCTDLDYYGRRSPVISSRSRSAASGVGYRSVFPRPLVTQHSRTSLQRSTSPRRRFDVDGDYAFVPSSPADLSIGDRVKVSRSGGSRQSHAFVKYVGHLPGKVGPYVGLELENEGGKHDGLHNGYRYFQCRGNRGIFLPFDRIMLAWRQ